MLTVNLVILALVLLLVFGLLRSHAAILRRLHELEARGAQRPGRHRSGSPTRLPRRAR